MIVHIPTKSDIAERKRERLAARLRKPTTGYLGTNKTRIASPVSAVVESARADARAQAETKRRESREALAARLRRR